MILIEKGGERQLVSSLDGYSGWTVVAEDVAMPTGFGKWEGAKWVPDPAAKAKALERDRLAKLTPDELIDEVLKRMGRE